MLCSTVLLLIVVLAGTSCLVDRVYATETLPEEVNENEGAVERIARALTQTELAVVSKYWKVYSKRRAEAVERCEARLYLYSNRRNMAKEFMIVKRNAAADMSDIKSAQQLTDVKETTLLECVNQIINLHGDDPFYREYQYLTTELQRVTDQVSSCLDAGGHIGPMKRQVGPTFDEQLVSRSSPQMLRVYSDIQRKKDIKKAEKDSCFESLAIPVNFPVQLEVLGP